MTIIIVLMAIAMLFGSLVLVALLLGRMYEMRHKVGDLNEELQQNEEQLRQFAQQVRQSQTRVNADKTEKTLEEKK